MYVILYHESIYCFNIWSMQQAEFLLIYYCEGAEIICGQVAGFTARYTAIWKSWDRYLLPCLHLK